MGGLLFLEERHYYKFKICLSIGSNNYIELMDFRSLTMLASEKWLNRLNIYGDSMLVIKWMNEDQWIQDITLQCLVIQLKKNKS